MEKKRFYPFPFLILIILIESIYLDYISYIEIQKIVLPLLCILGITAISWFTLSHFLKDNLKASLLVTVLCFATFSFRSSLKSLTIFGKLTSDNHLLQQIVETRMGNLGFLFFWIILLSVLIVRVHNIKTVPAKIIIALNLISFCFLVFITSLIVFLVNSIQVNGTPTCYLPETDTSCQNFWPEEIKSISPGTPLNNNGKFHLPNIYYIVLDSYGRSDILTHIYGLNNQLFLDSLKAMGFYVATNSKTNYNKTSQSLMSSLNMMYISDFYQAFFDKNKRPPNGDLLDNNALFAYLKSIGYKIITYSDDFYDINITSADSTFISDRMWDGFPTIILKSTPFSVVFFDFFYQQHRNRVIYTFNSMAELDQTEGPFFVIAHIISPHPPFVFESDGNAKNPDYFFSYRDGPDFLSLNTLDVYKSGYRDQVEFLNYALLPILSQITTSESTSNIVVLQGDHGPRSKLSDEEAINVDETIPILNAYFFPGGDYSLLYPEITPVNSFRVILRQFFFADIPLLADRNFFSPFRDIYHLEEVTTDPQK